MDERRAQVLKEVDRAVQHPESLPVWDGPLSHPFYSKVIKRILDFLLALILLIPSSVIMLPMALWVKLDSPGPVLYKAPRGGYHNRTFRIFKFRSMAVGSDRTGGTTALGDSRVTRAGRLMRRLKLDELPQLINILKGDMSFVGPRPELLLYTMQYTKDEECILWVRPGITDRSSIVFIAQDEILGPEDPVGNYEKYMLPEKNRLRVEYAKTQSFRLDLQLFFETLMGVFGKARGMAAKHRT
ncbi:MAG: sugar transferase [Clostridia bacterium]|nr:sugar transferase [Clostridia bacterium]